MKNTTLCNAGRFLLSNVCNLNPCVGSLSKLIVKDSKLEWLLTRYFFINQFYLQVRLHVAMNEIVMLLKM
jgi:hypothetical protein